MLLLKDPAVELWDPKPAGGATTTRVAVSVAGDPHPLVFAAKPSEDRAPVFSLSPPFRFATLSAAKGFPSQLRLFKEQKNEQGHMVSTAVILFPSLAPADWLAALRSCTQAAAATVVPPRDRSCVRVCSPDGSRVLATLPLETGLTVADVLDAVVHRGLGEVPALYNLVYSQHSSSAVVTDIPPASLQSFGGETLYLARRPGSVRAEDALEAWLGGDPAATKALRAWPTASETQRDGWKRTIASTLARLTEPLIELVYAQEAMLFRVTPARLHPIGGCMELSLGAAPVEREIRVTNIDRDPIRVLLELPSERKLGAGVSVVCTTTPSQVLLPGDVARFVVHFVASAPAASVSSFLSVSSCRVKAAKVVSKSDTPFLLPFSLVVRQIDGRHPKELALSELPRRTTILSVVDGCPIYTVTYEAQPMLLKEIRIPPGITWSEVRAKVAAVSALSHENVVSVEHFCISEADASVYLLFPDYSRGRRAVRSLRRVVLGEDSIKLGWPQTLKLAKDIATGILHVQTQLGLPYGRLSPESVLVVPSEDTAGLRASLCDFGALGDTFLTRLAEPHGDYVRIRAPEVVAKESLSEVDGAAVPAAATKISDVFDFGMLLYLLVCRFAPFSETRASWKECSALESRVLNEARPNIAFIPVDCPTGFRSLMVRCWEGVTARPPLSEVLEFLNSMDPRPATRLSLKEASERHLHDSSSGTSSPVATAQSQAAAASSSSSPSAAPAAPHPDPAAIPKSGSVDSIWELLNLPETTTSGIPRSPSGRAVGTPASSGHAPPQSPLAGQQSPHRKILEGDERHQNVKFKVTLPDGSKSTHILTPTDTVSRLLRKLGFPTHELVYSRSKETFSEKMLGRARQVRSSHSIVVDVCPLSELRDIKATVITLGASADGTVWERQDRIDAGRMHLSATSKDILRAIYHRMRSFQPRENVLLLNGRAMGSESTPLRQAPTVEPLPGQERPVPDQVEVTTVAPSAVVQVLVHHSSVQGSGSGSNPSSSASSSSLKDTTTEMRFWRQATLAQVRQCVASELGVPLSRMVLHAPGWGMLAKLSLALEDYIPEPATSADASHPLRLTVSTSSEVIEVLAENCGSCLVELSRDSTAASVRARGAEHFGCDTEQFLVCATTGALLSLETRVTAMHGPLVLLHEDACLRTTIGGREFAFSVAEGPVLVEALMRTIDGELILVYEHTIHPAAAHNIVPEATYQLEYHRPEEMCTIAVISATDGKPLLRMHAVRNKATVGDIAAYSAAQLGTRTPQLLDDAGVAFSPKMPLSSLPMEVIFRA